MLLTQKFKLSLESAGSQTKNDKINQKVNLLHNSLLIANWIANFDAASVNDCFDTKSSKVPPPI